MVGTGFSAPPSFFVTISLWIRRPVLLVRKDKTGVLWQDGAREVFAQMERLSLISLWFRVFFETVFRGELGNPC